MGAWDYITGAFDSAENVVKKGLDYLSSGYSQKAFEDTNYANHVMGYREATPEQEQALTEVQTGENPDANYYYAPPETIDEKIDRWMKNDQDSFVNNVKEAASHTMSYLEQNPYAAITGERVPSNPQTAVNTLKIVHDFAVGARQSYGELQRTTDDLDKVAYHDDETGTYIPKTGYTQNDVDFAVKQRNQALKTFRYETIYRVIPPAGIFENAMDSYSSGGLGKVGRDLTYGPLVDIMSDPDFQQKFNENPEAMNANVLMAGSQLIPLAGVLGGTFSKGKRYFSMKTAKEVGKETAEKEVTPGAMSSEAPAATATASMSDADISASIDRWQRDHDNPTQNNTSAQPGTVDADIQDASAQYGVSPALIRSVIKAESSFNPDAKSPVGAIGYMQLMPETAEGLGVDPHNPRQNIMGGTKYLRQLLDEFDGDTEKALAAYNAGPEAVKKYGGIPPYKETQAYVSKIMDDLKNESEERPRMAENGEANVNVSNEEETGSRAATEDQESIEYNKPLTSEEKAVGKTLGEEKAAEIQEEGISEGKTPEKFALYDEEKDAAIEKELNEAIQSGKHLTNDDIKAIVNKHYTSDIPDNVQAALGTPSTKNGTGSAKPVTRAEINKTVNDLVTSRTGRIGFAGAKGIFKVDKDVIRSRNFGDFDTQAHEVGHYLDKQLKISGHDSELISAADNIWGGNKIYDKYTPEQRRAEGIAEFTRQYLTDPAKAKQNFPGYYNDFVDKLGQNKDLAVKVQDIGDKMQRWFNQSPEARGRGGVSFGNDTGIFDTIKDKATNAAYKAYEAFFDDKVDLARQSAAIEKQIGQELKYEKNPYKKARMVQTSALARAEMLVWDDNPTLVRDTLNKIYNNKLRYDVTMKEIFNGLDKKNLDGKYPGYLQNGNFKNWHEALSTLLTAKKQLENYKVKTLDVRAEYQKAYNIARQELFNAKANLDNVRKNKHNSYTQHRFAVLKAEEIVDEATTKFKQAEDALKKANSTEYKGPMSNADAETIVKNAPKELDDLTEKVYQYSDNLLSIAQECGLISQKTVDALHQKYKNYVPMSREFSDEAAMENTFATGKKIGNVSNPLKKLTDEGSTRNVIDPLENLIKNTYTLLSAAERNKVAQTFVALSKESGLGEFAEAVSGGSGDAKSSIFTVMVDGKKQAFQTTPEFYRAIMSMNQASANMLISIFKPFAQALRVGATISPDFVVRNLIRDTLTAGIYSETGFKPVLDTAKGVLSLVKDKELAYEFKASGAPLSAFVGLDRKGVNRMIDEAVNGKNWENPLTYIRAGYDGLREVSEAAESGTRIREFERARQQGKSIDEAGLLAKNVTLDFSRAGTLTRQINQVIPFFNAALQGGDRFIRGMINNPKRAIPLALMYITLPSIVTWLMNHDKDWYKELSDDIKNGCWLLEHNGTIIRVPKPFEPGIFFGSAVERALDKAYGEDPKAVEKWVSYAAQGFAPNVIPTLVGPIIEWMTNYSFFTGKSVVGKKEQRLPDEYQFNDYTSEAAKKLGRATGLSPEKIDNTINGYLGSAGKFFVGLGDTFIGDKKEMPAKNWNEIPGVRGLTYTSFKNSNSVNEFYEKLDEMEKNHAATGKKGIVPADLKKFRTAEQTIKDLHKENRGITSNVNLSAEQKRQKIDTNNAKILQLAKKALGKN
ncbi:MAG: hypothetical protein H6Q73_203 [Firmicutes bacterium]|nr:hypothetical protein [Bacillota bacterium]